MDALYKNKDGQVYAVSPIQNPPEGWIKLTPAEMDAHLNPPPAPKPVPQSVSRAQGKAALIGAGLWADVLAFVEAIEDPTEKALAEVALHDTTEWRRDSPFLSQAATSLGMSEADLDDLFMAASEIVL